MFINGDCDKTDFRRLIFACTVTSLLPVLHYPWPGLLYMYTCTSTFVIACIHFLYSKTYAKSLSGFSTTWYSIETKYQIQGYSRILCFSTIIIWLSCDHVFCAFMTMHTWKWNWHSVHSFMTLILLLWPTGPSLWLLPQGWVYIYL